MFLTSAKPTIRFAAVKTLNRIAMIHPDAVTSCNVDLENLISDSNRSIATLAITTLLKVHVRSGREGEGGGHQLGSIHAILNMHARAKCMYFFPILPASNVNVAGYILFPAVCAKL